MTDEQIEDWRAKWTAELEDLIRRIPPGIKSQLIEYHNVQIGIRVLTK